MTRVCNHKQSVRAGPYTTRNWRIVCELTQAGLVAIADCWMELAAGPKMEGEIGRAHV
jgi:hypothetical protein